LPISNVVRKRLCLFRT